MKIKDLTKPLYEAPLPPEWDKQVYTPQTSFAKQLKYALARAAKVGAGSGRVAVEIQYEGRPTVLKIAKNKKGLAQNEYEAQTLSEYMIKDTGLFIPIIDYDEEHEPPLWLHTEKAEKIKPTQFKKFFGVDHNTLDFVLQYGTGNHKYGSTEGFDELIENNEMLYDLVQIVGNYGMPTGDFSRLANWGIFKGRPVVIDVGLSQGVYDQYYAPKQRPGW